MISSVDSTTFTDTSSKATTKKTLGKDDFLNLLVSQLRFQDPMNPLKGTEFAAQLAQFSSVEQLSNMNTQLAQSAESNTVLTQSINNALSATFIGKDVRAQASAFQYSGDGEAQLGYTLGAAAGSATVDVVDANGYTVRTLTDLGTDKGENEFTWDGKDDSGQPAAAGQYSFKVTVKDTGGNAMDYQQFIRGTVEAVRFRQTGTVFVIDGLEVALSNILEIKKG